MAGSIQGVIATVVWGYYNAAAIEGYTVTFSAAGAWSATGRVVMSDSFKLSQRPLMFVAPFDRGRWRWPITSMHVHEGQLVAELGEPLPD
jgi:hypothetical protein